MLSPKEFITRWGKHDAALIRFPKESLEGLSLADEDKEWLLLAGLPRSAAPFVSFEAPCWGQLHLVADLWDQPQLSHSFREIGHDGCGNSIALDEEHPGDVVYLDHDNRFARVLINRSVRQLAEALLTYRQLVEDSRAEMGSDAYIEGKISSAIRDRCRMELMRIDPDAMKPDNFWHEQMQNLDANANWRE